MASGVQGYCSSTVSPDLILSRGEGSAKLRIRLLWAKSPGGAPRLSFGPIIQVDSESGNSLDKKGGDLLNCYNMI